MGKGLFIVFEGGEGSGKSTMLHRVAEWLRGVNIECITTREPGGIKISENIREIILDKDNTNMDSRTEALLYAAARRQHLIEKVVPAINDGNIVLCDRFIDSSLAYQGYARNLGIDEIYNINKFAIDEYMPDLTLFFDLNPEEGLRRINNDNNREVNRLDLEKMDFHYKVREGYNILLERYKNRIVRIDASKSIDEVFNEVKNILEKNINI